MKQNKKLVWIGWRQVDNART